MRVWQRFLASRYSRPIRRMWERMLGRYFKGMDQ